MDGHFDPFSNCCMLGPLSSAVSLSRVRCGSEIRGYRRLYVLGYSLGGHVSLRLALEKLATPLRAVAAVCPPLDLVTCAKALDEEVAPLDRPAEDRSWVPLGRQSCVSSPGAGAERAYSNRR